MKPYDPVEPEETYFDPAFEWEPGTVWVELEIPQWDAKNDGVTEIEVIPLEPEVSGLENISSHEAGPPMPEVEAKPLTLMPYLEAPPESEAPPEMHEQEEMHSDAEFKDIRDRLGEKAANRWAQRHHPKGV